MFVCLSLYLLLPDLWRIKLFKNCTSSGSSVRSEILRPKSTRNETDETLSGPCVPTATIIIIIIIIVVVAAVDGSVPTCVLWLPIQK